MQLFLTGAVINLKRLMKKRLPETTIGVPAARRPGYNKASFVFLFAA
jgi:hypothetical protein